MESLPEENNINNKYLILGDDKGEGATAKVYLVEDKNDKKQYAAKVFSIDPSLFEKEIDILKKVSALNNPYIMKLIDYGEGPVKTPSEPKKNLKYAILEYASKGILYDYIHYPQKGFSERHAKLIFHKILKGVQAIHNVGFCHRDIKMENILVDDKFNPKICDFGFAAETKGKDNSGKLDEYVGTHNYAAPEIHLNIKYEGIKADIFSLGVVLFSLVTGGFGFGKAIKDDILYCHIKDINFPKYWDVLIAAMDLIDKKIKNAIINLTDEFKNLYINMISYSPELRPNIDDILKDPWMKDVTSLDDKRYNELEKEVYKEFEKREIDVVANKEETIQTDSNSSNEFSYENDRGVSEDEVEYFDLNLTPKYIQKIGLNMNNYIKIIGNLRPCHFMNSLANKIAKNFENNAKIKESKNSLKFNVIFEENLEDKEEPDEELEKGLDKLSLEKNDEIKVVITHKNCIIQIALFQSLNGGYLARFVKKEGEIEDYYKNLDSIKSIIKKIL
jgi:serine/threonine protein kinase